MGPWIHGSAAGVAARAATSAAAGAAASAAEMYFTTYIWGAAKRPPGGILLSLGFCLGRLPFGSYHFLTTFLAYVLRRPKTIILQFFELPLLL